MERLDGGLTDKETAVWLVLMDADSDDAIL